MTIIFDDGMLGFTYGTRRYQNDGRSYSPNYDARYDSSIDDNYVFEDLRGNGRQPKERWTYTFTSADYHAAEAMAPFE